MMPAHQPLDRDDAAAAQVDLWLVVQAQALGLDRLAQLPRQTRAVQPFLIDGGLVGSAASADPLGAVHRDVSTA
jgi:hypothetical protein